MSTMLICPDVSEFQRPLDHTYTRDFAIFRVTFGAHRLDHNFLANASAAKALYQRGQIKGVLLYTVYTAEPVRAQFDGVWKAIGPAIPLWLTGIMIDVESWRGQDYELRGNHSRAINQLYGMHAHRMGSWSSVIAYGNQSDLAHLYPGRDKRCRVIVAGYTSQLVYKKVPGAIGQQYSDGSARWPVPKIHGVALPRASAPFRHCDHNVFPDHPNATSLVKLLRPAQLLKHAAPPAPRKPVAKRPLHPVAPRPPARHAAGPPAAPAAPHAYNPARGNLLVSPNGQYALILQDNGSVEVCHNGTRTAALKGN